MRERVSRTVLGSGLAFALLVTAPPPVRAQINGGADRNTSQRAGDDNECAVAKDPTNRNRLFISCNTSGAGLFASRSTDGGNNWVFTDATDGTIADGDANQGPAACCDPTVAWDTFGNLYLAYLNAAITAVEVLVSTDGGANFRNLANLPARGVDQPTIVAANTTAGVQVWVTYKRNAGIAARGATATALGTVGAFSAEQVAPGTLDCNFGDIAVSRAGAVAVTCQSPVPGQGPSTIRVSTDANGLGAGGFGAAVDATTTNVGGFDFIPPQNARSVDAEAGLAFDNNAASPRAGRLYLAYANESPAESGDTNIFVRFSDDNGGTWSAPVRLNDDTTTRSQFLQRISVDDTTGVVAVCWHDCRNSATNTAAQTFCAASPPTDPPEFIARGRISDGASVSNGAGVEFGDYAGLVFRDGVLHGAWADTANTTGNNPNGNANFDAYTDRATVAVPPRLTVRKILVHPDHNHLRLFNLQIDGVTVRANANGGSSGPQVVTPGVHTVGETGGTGTSLGAFHTVIGGDCAPNGTVSLAPGDNKTCTITNYDNYGGCPSSRRCCEPGDGTAGCRLCVPRTGHCP